MGFLKLILILILGYYLFKLLARWFGPMLFSYAVRKTEKKFREQFGNFEPYNQHDEEIEIGDVSIDKKPTKRKTTSRDVGEYIEFEELE